MSTTSRGRKYKSVDLLENLSFNDYGLVFRQMDGGYPFNPSSIGTISTTPLRAGKHTPVRIYNATGSTIYVATGADDTMSAPTGMTDGLAIPNGTIMIINTGDQMYIAFNVVSANAQYIIAQDDGLHED